MTTATMTAVTLPTSKVAVEHDSFEALYDQHKKKVYSLCLRMVGNTTDAEDLTQEVFLQVYRKLESFRGESSFSTWLHRLTVNTVLMHFRRERSRHEEAMEDQDLQRLVHADPSTHAHNDRNMVNRIALREAISQLPSGYRRVLLLHDVEGYEHDEIGRKLGITGGTTKSQLHKARAKLRHILRKPARPGTRDRVVRRRGTATELLQSTLTAKSLSRPSPAAA